MGVQDVLSMMARLWVMFVHSKASGAFFYDREGSF